MSTIWAMISGSLYYSVINLHTFWHSNLPSEDKAGILWCRGRTQGRAVRTEELKQRWFQIEVSQSLQSTCKLQAQFPHYPQGLRMPVLLRTIGCPQSILQTLSFPHCLTAVTRYPARSHWEEEEFLVAYSEGPHWPSWQGWQQEHEAVGHTAPHSSSFADGLRPCAREWCYWHLGCVFTH